MNWEAIVAWIALAVSIACPFITTICSNRHQLKLRKLDIAEKQAESFNAAKTLAIENFISSVGKYLVAPDTLTIEECGKYYFQVYAYVPQALWSNLDELYELILHGKWVEAKGIYQEIIHPLAAQLKESLPKNQ